MRGGGGGRGRETRNSVGGQRMPERDERFLETSATVAQASIRPEPGARAVSCTCSCAAHESSLPPFSSSHPLPLPYTHISFSQKRGLLLTLMP